MSKNKENSLKIPQFFLAQPVKTGSQCVHTKKKTTPKTFIKWRVSRDSLPFSGQKTLPGNGFCKVFCFSKIIAKDVCPHSL